MRDYLQELTILQDLHNKRGYSIDSLTSGEYFLYGKQPIHFEQWQDEPQDFANMVRAKPDSEQARAYDMEIWGGAYQGGQSGTIPLYYLTDKGSLSENQPQPDKVLLSLDYYIFLGCMGRTPSMQDLFNLLATYLVIEGKSKKPIERVLAGINEKTFNDYADILRTIEVAYPHYSKPKGYSRLLQQALNRIKWARDFVNQSGQTTFSNLSTVYHDKMKSLGVEEPDLTSIDNDKLQAIGKESPEAQQAIIDLVIGGVKMRGFGATIEAYDSEQKRLEGELALVKAKDKQALIREGIYKAIRGDAIKERQRDNLEQLTDFNAPTNSLIIALGKLFPLFSKITSDEDTAKVGAYKQAKANSQDELTEFKERIKAKKAEIEKENSSPFPDTAKIEQLTTELNAIKDDKDSKYKTLWDLSANILPFEGNKDLQPGYYRNTNTLETHIDDNGYISLTTEGKNASTTITMPPYVAIGESLGDAGTAKDIQRAILIKVREGKNLAGFFTNEEIYQIMLGKQGSALASLQVRKNAKQDFLRYLDYLSLTRIENAKTKPSEKDKRNKEAPTIKGFFITYIGKDYKGVSFKLNEGLFLWAIIENESYTSIAEGIANLDNHSYKNAYAYLSQQETMNGASMARNYTYGGFFESNPDFRDPAKVDPSHKGRETKKVITMLETLKKQGLLADERHGKEGFNFITAKGDRSNKSKKPKK